MKKSFKLFQLITALSFFCLLNSCDIEIEPQCVFNCWDDGYPGRSHIEYKDIVGDIDGFGIGLLTGELWNPDLLATSQPIDFRGVDDPYFTDIYPATENGVIEYAHSFEIKGDGTIHFASLSLLTMGIQDGEYIDSLGMVDVKLFLDNIEIVDAFKGRFQFELVDNQWIPKVGFIRFGANSNQFENLLKDGELKVRIEIVPSSLSNEMIDFAIDHSNLRIIWNE